MSLFNRIKPKIIVIIGCGRLGSTLAEMLYEQNFHVTVVDNDERAFRKLSPSYGGFTIEGDGCDPDILVEAGSNNADILVATTDDDNTNIMIAQMARQAFQISRVIARIYDTSKLSACIGGNIDFICPALLSIEEFKAIVLQSEASEI
jgi:trk system potassium uptake protein TrkA